MSRPDVDQKGYCAVGWNLKELRTVISSIKSVGHCICQFVVFEVLLLCSMFLKYHSFSTSVLFSWRYIFVDRFWWIFILVGTLITNKSQTKLFNSWIWIWIMYLCAIGSKGQSKNLLENKICSKIYLHLFSLTSLAAYGNQSWINWPIDSNRLIDSTSIAHVT